MSAFDLLSQEAARLLHEGKTPSLALLRSRLGRKVSPAELLPAFQQWKQLPAEAQRSIQLSASAEATAPGPDKSDSLAERVQQLETKLAELEKRLTRLES
ncbi:MAG: hypothetical protein JJU30_04950 [Alkalimonas sp.]|nr:hypothetical protein [Alkalimonas sp.]